LSAALGASDSGGGASILQPERDSFISATALVHRLVLVTRNIKDFETMGVDLFNPWAAER